MIISIIALVVSLSCLVITGQALVEIRSAHRELKATGHRMLAINAARERESRNMDVLRRAEWESAQRDIDDERNRVPKRPVFEA